jgi:2-methylisocitrate lyase-like PEP mutase family enzyme
MTPRQELRRLIGRTGYTMVPGAYDSLTARLVEAAGFAAVYLTGGGYSRANGYPDLGLLSRPRTSSSSAAPGGGRDPCHRRRRYRLWQRDKRDPHGARIREDWGRRLPHEDQVSPKKCGHYEGKEVIVRPRWSARSRPGRYQVGADLVTSPARRTRDRGLQASIDRVNAY